ncbi:MAG: MoaD family protein [Gemmatimonadota bacterium]
MPVTVLIPTVLQKLTDGRDSIEASGQTISDVIAALRTTHGPLVERITNGDGAFKPFLNVFVNGDDIRFAGELQTPVRDGDEISIIPSIAGG